MEPGLVSVIVPVYNRVKLVASAIESILAQTYQKIEIVLVNDGSSDGSLLVINSYKAQYPDKITVIDQPNQGQVASRNNAIRVAKGEYIAFLDSDDLWKPEKLSLQIPLFQENVGLVYSAIDNIDENGKFLDTVLCDESITGNIYSHLLVRNRMTGGTVVVLHEALNEVGLFDESFSAAENWDLWIRICRKHQARLVNVPLVQYRVHQGNMSKDGLLMLAAKEAILEKHCSEVPGNTELASYHNLAKADLAYWKGVYFFSNENYAESRTFFLKAHKLVPYYEDCAIRVLRSYLGKFGNNLISSCKNLKNRILAK